MLFLTPRASELQLLQKHSIACKGASSLGLHILPRETTPDFHTAQRDHHPHRCCCYPDHCSRPAVHHQAPCLQIICSRQMRAKHAKLLLLAELRSSRFAVRRNASARPDWTTQQPTSGTTKGWMINGHETVFCWVININTKTKLGCQVDYKKNWVIIVK